VSGKRRLLKELKVKALEEETAKAKSLPLAEVASRSRKPLVLAVAHRRQTPEEQRRFNAALDVFLSEWVRQHLGPHE